MSDEQSKAAVFKIFFDKFLDIKNYLLSLNLKDQYNLNLAIINIDDGFFRAREAIFAISDPANESQMPEEEVKPEEEKIASASIN